VEEIMNDLKKTKKPDGVMFEKKYDASSFFDQEDRRKEK
jgi:hypothetical protein